MYIDASIKNYLDDLAARKPAPGGGSAAALEAATGCALLSMVANYTISNKKYVDYHEVAKEHLGTAEVFRARLMELIDKDVEAYKKLSDGMKTLKDKPTELSNLYKEACNVPLAICKICGEAIKLAKELTEHGNKNLITDSAISALMLESAFSSAALNVIINQPGIKDEAYIAKCNDELLKLKDDVRKTREGVVEYVGHTFGG